MTGGDKNILVNQLDPATTALVLIDLQNGIVGLDVAPKSGPEIVAGCKKLAATFRAAGAPVVLVHVGWGKDFADAPDQPVDQPSRHGAGGLPDGWSDLVDGLQHPGDLTILKRQWSAFHGTELDLQLRRRGIRTIVLAGIATNIGVESTARQAWEHGYNLIVTPDLCASFSAAWHDFSVRNIMPRIGLVVESDSIGFKADSD